MRRRMRARVVEVMRAGGVAIERFELERSRDLL